MIGAAQLHHFISIRSTCATIVWGIVMWMFLLLSHARAHSYRTNLQRDKNSWIELCNCLVVLPSANILSLRPFNWA